MVEPQSIRGYHGTVSSAIPGILADGFGVSQNVYDWLGDGAYFWQDAPGRAWEWAAQLYGSEAAVVRADIVLADCMDLLDVGWNRLLADTYDSFLQQWKASGRRLPTQRNGYHRLDREVMNYTVGVLAKSGISIRAVRAAFREGTPVYPNSAFFDRSHIQVAVRDLSLITNITVERRSIE